VLKALKQEKLARQNSGEVKQSSNEVNAVIGIMGHMVIENRKREIMADLRKYFKSRFSP